MEDLANSSYMDDEDNIQDLSKEIKYSNTVLFTKWIQWVERNRYDLKYSNGAFHTRLGLLMKKKINVNEIIIHKDTNHNTYINFMKLKDYQKGN